MKSFISAVFILLLFQAFSQHKAYIPFRQGKLWCLANEKGEILFEPKFEELFPSTSKLVRFRKGDKYGFIDTNGDIVLEPIFTKASDFDFQGASVTIGDSTFYINQNGDQIFPLGYCGGIMGINANPHVIFENNGRFGSKTYWGDTVLKAEYLQIKRYYSSTFIAAQHTNYKFSIVDKTGKTIIPAELDSVAYYYEKSHHGFYKIYQDGNEGAVTGNGTIILEPKYYFIDLYINTDKMSFFRVFKEDRLLGYFYGGKEYWRD